MVLGVPATERWRILLRMIFSPPSHQRTARGFTIIELLVVIAIIVLIAALLIPALGKAHRSAMSAEDKTQARGIHSAMMLFASGNEGQFPRPSIVTKGYESVDHDTSDTTANLMSFMIARNYFNTAHLISPVEANPNIQDMNVYAELSASDNNEYYDYESIDGRDVFWDDAFNCDIDSITAESPANNSYAHQALCGQRIRLKWHSSAGSSDIIISNRGPRDGDVGPTGDSESFTFKFHTSDDDWAGNIVLGDGSSRFVNSVFPEGIAYQPLNGYPLGPDNIFFTDWDDISDDIAPPGMPSGDNWMVICDEWISENEINPVWD